MICKECGAKIPDGAKFCGECGWVVDEKEAKKAEQKAKEAAKKKQRAESPVEILRLKRQVRKYRILTWVFAVLFALMMMAFAGANMDDTGGGGNVPPVPLCCRVAIWARQGGVRVPRCLGRRSAWIRLVQDCRWRAPFAEFAALAFHWLPFASGERDGR